jgi:hypothetical protein
MDVDLTIRGIQEAQAANNRRIAMLQPSGSFGMLVRNVTVYMHRQAVAVTHVDTGSLRASHRMEVTEVRGRVFIDPDAVNPRTSEKPVDYGQIEHARGGQHAFYRLARIATTAYLRHLVREFEEELVE